MTTHSMEEADALSDDIVIMVRGAVQAIGPGLLLKRRLVAARYRIQVLLEDAPEDGRASKVVELLRGKLRVTEEEVGAGSVTVGVAAESEKDLEGVLRTIERRGNSLGIR